VATRKTIERRWKQIDRELAELAEGNVVRGKDLGKLLEELYALEYEAGLLYFQERRRQNER